MTARVVTLGAGASVAGMALLAASGWLVTRAAEQPPVLALLAAIVVVRALGLVRAFGRYAERLVAHDAAFRTLAALRVRWYRRLIATPVGVLPADLLSRFVVDVDELQHRDLRVRWPAAVAAVAGTAASGLAAAILPAAGAVLAAGLLAAGTLVPAASYLVANRALRRRGAARAAMIDELVEAMDLAPELALAGRGRERMARLDAVSDDLSAITRRDAAAAALAQGLGGLIAGATLVGVLVVARDLQPVWLGALALLALGAFETVGALPEAAVRAVDVEAAERRLAEAVGKPTNGEARRAPHATPAAARSGPVLTATALRHRPGGGPLVLDGLNLALAAGQRVAVIGASGAGKTVLLNLLAGLDAPDEGEIALDGVPIEATDTLAHVRLAGQEAHVFATSIANNVRIGKPDASDAEVEVALRLTGLDEWLDALPDGVDTLVGEEGFAVSGGQRQRIALARCLVSPARLLLLDEPTAMLDAPAARAFFADLDRAAGDRGVLVVTHQRGDVLGAFDAVLELRDGGLSPRPRPRSRPRPATSPPALPG